MLFGIPITYLFMEATRFAVTGFQGEFWPGRFASFVSGIMIFIYEPFRLGDRIIVDGKEGEVVDINLRYVTLENENLKMLVPNSLLVSESLEIKK